MNNNNTCSLPSHKASIAYVWHKNAFDWRCVCACALPLIGCINHFHMAAGSSICHWRVSLSAHGEVHSDTGGMPPSSTSTSCCFMSFLQHSACALNKFTCFVTSGGVYCTWLLKFISCPFQGILPPVLWQFFFFSLLSLSWLFPYLFVDYFVKHNQHTLFLIYPELISVYLFSS